MSSPQNPMTDDSWKPKAVREAESRLAATMTSAESLAQEVEQMRIQPADTTAKPEEIAALKASAESRDAPEEMRLLKRKVDAGEFSWTDVLEGRAYQDPEVRAAMSTKLGPLREVYQDFEEGHTLDDVLEAAGHGGPLAEEGAAANSPDPAEPADADDYFTEGPLTDDADTPARPTEQSAPTPPASPQPPQTPQTPEPPAPEPPARPGPTEADDYFNDPLAESDDPEPPAGPKPTRRRPRDEQRGDDDDYFGGSPFDR